jgi:DNA-binding transcriptional LysR family regulator
MRSSIDIKHLRTFLVVAETGNMTHAARELGMTQSAISQIVRLLEDDLGVLLFDRVHRPLRLTAPGVILARRAGKLIADADRISSAVREAATVPEIRIGMIDSFAGTVGPHLIRAFVDKVGHLKLWAGLTPSLVDSLTARKLDLLFSSDDVDRLEGIRIDPILREPYLLAVPERFAEEARRSGLEWLADRLQLVRYSARSSVGQQIDRHLRRLDLNVERHLEIDSSDTVFAMVAEEVGFAITTPLCILHGRPDMRRLAILPLPGPAVSRGIVLASRPGEYEETAIRIAASARQTITDICIPQIRRYAAWAAADMQVLHPARKGDTVEGAPGATVRIAS